MSNLWRNEGVINDSNENQIGSAFSWRGKKITIVHHRAATSNRKIPTPTTTMQGETKEEVPFTTPSKTSLKQAPPRDDAHPLMPDEFFNNGGFFCSLFFCKER